MKYIFTTLLMAVLLIGSSFNEIKAQNLQFNSAVFYEYGPVSTTSSNIYTVVFTGELVVAANQVLKITSLYSNKITGSLGPGYIQVNGHVLTSSVTGGGETYLPSGNYVITYTNVINLGGDVSAYISGVLYDVVP